MSSKTKKSGSDKPKSTKSSTTAPTGPSELIVRPSGTSGLNSSKVYVNLDTLRSLEIDAGSFVQISTSPNVVGVVTPASAEADVVKVSSELRKISGISLGDKIRLAKVPRPEYAGSVHIYTEAAIDDKAVKDMLQEISVVNLGQNFNGITITGLLESSSTDADVAAMDHALEKLSLSPQSKTKQAVPMSINGSTKIVFSSQKPPRSLTVGYGHIGGLDREIKALRSKIELPLNRPELFERFQTQPERGFLLYGPPGTGKTLLLKAVANETEAHVVRVNGPSLYSKYLGQTESQLRDIFEEAQRFAPAIIFIDEIDALAPKRDGDESGETESRVVATLLTLMDGMSAGGRVVVIGATNRPNTLDPALRRPGRFGQEIEIGIPDATARKAILDLQLEHMPHHLTAADITELSSKTHGYVGADLEALSREAVMTAIEAGISKELTDDNMFVEKSHYDHAFTVVRPSAMREIFLETPKVHWTDIGGQESVIQQLKETVEWPLRHQASFERLGITPPRGVLLYGPPGNSKTLLVKALATEAGLNFLAVKGPEIFNKYVGESERAIREVFRKARATSPSIVFFDEIDALSVSRGGDAGSSGDRVLTSLLNEMDGIEALTGVVIIAATNRPDVIDSALMRPGRLDRLIYVSPPDLAARRQILLIQLSKMAVDESVDIDILSTQTDGCSGAEVVSLCQEAGLLALNEDVEITAIRQEHFDAALATLRRNITPDMLKYFESFAAQ